MAMIDTLRRIMRFPSQPGFLGLLAFCALLFFVVVSVALQYQFYGEWLLRYPLYCLILAFLLLVTYNRFGQDFGLSHLFWHENRLIQFRMGFYVSLLLALQWGIAYEILRDFDGNEQFKDMGTFRDRALLIPALVWTPDASAVDLEYQKKARFKEVANPQGPFRWWPIDANEARVSAYLASGEQPDLATHRDDAGPMAKRYSLYYAFTYLPSLALLAMAIFPPLVPPRPKDCRQGGDKRFDGVRGAGDGYWFVGGMLSAAVVAYGLIVPCSIVYTWAIQKSRLQQAVYTLESASVPIAGMNVPVCLAAFVLAIVALLLNHKNTARAAWKYDYVILVLLALSILLTATQLRVWFPDLSAAQDMAPRIVSWRAVEMVLNIFVITAIIGLLYCVMKYIYRRQTSTGKELITSQGAICMMLALVSVVYGSFIQLFWLADVEGMPIIQLGFCLPLIAFLIWRNSDRFKQRFPGMADYYEQTAVGANAVRLREDYLRSVNGNGQWGAGQATLLDTAEVLKNWLELVAPAAGSGWVKPKLAIVAVSGGSIRSGLWTAKVLTELEQAITGFPHHLRLITGASGGMIGASLYAAELEQPAPGAVAHARDPGRLDRLVKRLNYDCLNPVACQLALGDLPAIFSGRPQRSDRGQALEQAWEKLSAGLLGKPFDSHAKGELQGWRPSLVFSPMLAEDGRRLLISNLDLEFLTRSEGPCLLDALSRRLSDRQRRHPSDELYSLSAYQFYRLFPEAKPTFKLSTAIRMSASFPYISPAVSLPTEPPRRVVDAGYYDNFGVNLAMSWVAHHRQWLLDNTSGVVLIQVRAFDSPRDIDSAEKEQAATQPTRSRASQAWKNSFYGLTTPVKAVLQARSAGMSFRNDEQIAMLAQWFQEQEQEPNGPEFFQTVSFDCDATASLNWYITQSEFDSIVGCFSPRAANGNWERLDALRAWWNDGRDKAPQDLNLVDSRPSDQPESLSTVERR